MATIISINYRSPSGCRSIDEKRRCEIIENGQTKKQTVSPYELCEELRKGRMWNVIHKGDRNMSIEIYDKVGDRVFERH